MSFLLWYIPLHLVMGSLVVWCMIKYVLREERVITIGHLIGFAVLFAVWPAGLIVAAANDPSFFRFDTVIYRRKP